MYFFKSSIEILIALVQFSDCNSCCFSILKDTVFWEIATVVQFTTSLTLDYKDSLILKLCVSVLYKVINRHFLDFLLFGFILKRSGLFIEKS